MNDLAEVVERNREIIEKEFEKTLYKLRLSEHEIKLLRAGFFAGFLNCYNNYR